MAASIPVLRVFFRKRNEVSPSDTTCGHRYGAGGTELTMQRPRHGHSTAITADRGSRPVPASEALGIDNRLSFGLVLRLDEVKVHFHRGSGPYSHNGGSESSFWVP